MPTHFVQFSTYDIHPSYQSQEIFHHSPEKILADTRADIKIPANTWVDLYAASGIAVGTAVAVYNKGSNPCNVAIKATKPTTSTFGFPLYSGAVGSLGVAPASSSGLWCFSDSGSIVLVQE